MAFTVLTAVQGAELRDRIGDVDSNNYDLSDTVLDTLYTDASSDLDLATVYAIRRRLGILSKEVDEAGSREIGEQRHQRFDNLMRLLELWSDIAGVGQGELTMGTIDMNLDTDAADVDFTS